MSPRVCLPNNLCARFISRTTETITGLILYFLLCLVLKFTSPGDTVLDIGVETTQLLEVTLDRGRRSNCFLADDNEADGIREPVHLTLLEASTSRMFQVPIAVSRSSDFDICQREAVHLVICARFSCRAIMFGGGWFDFHHGFAVLRDGMARGVMIVVSTASALSHLFAEFIIY